MNVMEKMMTTKIEGQLEIDNERGVIYFHSHRDYTVLRICRLPIPLPKGNRVDFPFLDITHMHGVSW